MQGSRAHQSGHGTAEAHEQRDKRLAAEPEQPQRIIRDKRAARHIPAVLKQTEEEKEQGYLRQKGAHGAQSREYSAADQVFHPLGRAERAENAYKSG